MFYEEVGAVDFGDKRLSRRLIMVGEQIGQRVQSLICSLFTSKAEREGAYRLFSNTKVKVETLKKAHAEVVAQRIAACGDPIVAIQDSTYLNYDTHPHTRNLGRIGAKRDNTYGLIVHTTLAVNARTRASLGILDQRTFYHHADAPPHKHTPIEDKESYRWIESLRATHERAPEAVTLCDREGDIFEFYQEALQRGATVIIRQSWDRRVQQSSGRQRLCDTLAATPWGGQATVEYEGQTIVMRVKYARVHLMAPRRSAAAKGKRVYQTLPCSVVSAAGADRHGREIAWHLITTRPVTDIDQAKEVLALYQLRWHIESFHKCLKTGFKIEAAQLEERTKIERLLMVVSINAARMYGMLHHARAAPHTGVDLFLSPEEWKALGWLMYKKPVTAPPHLQDAVFFIASHGGFQATKLYPYPGVLTFWRGWLIIQAQLEAVQLVWNR